MPTYRILVVDDYEPFHKVVRLILQLRDDLQIVGEASDGLEAVQKAKALRPDLILLDIDLPRLNGIQVARRLRDLVPRPKVLFLSVESSSDVVREALNVGGAGYIYKLHVGSELLRAIDTVLRGKQFVSGGLNEGVSMPMTATTVSWALRGRGYEFCNCDFGCGCSFRGHPNSKDGSCRAFVGMDIDSGSCGGIALSGLKCAAIVDWPKAIHEGQGQCVFVVEPSATNKQIEALGRIFTGKLGGMPWELLGPTFEVKGLVKTKITTEGSGPKSVFRAEGIGEGSGDTFKNPVTGEDHLANIELPQGFFWKKGQCGQGTFQAKAAGLSIGAEKSNWVFYNFDWSNGLAPVKVG
jgi:CheY-like chemotaxis protein